MDEKCLIMMTSYNGEKYIAEQIESIRQQTYTNWELIIQDDQSTDSTIKIIQSFIDKDDRISLRINKGIHGAYQNWHELINFCKSLELRECYLFCDHDDIWLPNKLEVMLSYYVNNCKKDIPTLIYADMEVINSEGERIAPNFSEYAGQKMYNSYDIFYQNSVYGCNTIFNAELFRIVPMLEPNKGRAHDTYYAMFAAALGNLIYLPITTMQYRRHGHNVSNTPNDFGWKRILNRLAALNRLAEDHAYNYKQSLDVFDTIRENDFCMIDAKRINLIEKSIRSGGIIGLLIFLRLHVRCGNNLRTLSRAIILLIGNYKKYL